MPSYRARWIFPVDQPPMADGVLVVEEGRIAALRSQSQPDTLDLGNVALLPGLVNCHTHLEFSHLPEPVQPPSPFTAWIRSLVKERRERDPALAGDDLQQGCRECRDTGSVLAGEIATRSDTASAYDAAGPGVFLYREVIGFTADKIPEQLEIARQHLQVDTVTESPAIVQRGLSPHAPYSVHPELFRQLVYLAVEQRAPVTMHLAETRAELELLARGTGEFAEMLQRFGVWDPQVLPPGGRILDYLEPLEEVTCGLVIHGNYLTAVEQAFLAEHPQLTTVYCPRTHAFFGHEPHPWRELLAAGARVALGTDSRGSNPDLSLWREVQFLHQRFRAVSPSLLLELATVRGAEALGMNESYGTLTPGKLAQVAVADLSAGTGDPYSLLLAASVRRAEPQQPTGV